MKLYYYLDVYEPLLFGYKLFSHILPGILYVNHFIIARYLNQTVIKKVGLTIRKGSLAFHVIVPCDKILALEFLCMILRI